FDNTICNNCERCVIICIMNLWRKREGKIYLSNDYTTKCLECAACFQVCDAGAITFNYPAGGTGIVIEKG
ncbi:MAG: 4Fe-4S dicluster domain-containing protein, partial [Promethearchaeota archaeon]